MRKPVFIPAILAVVMTASSVVGPSAQASQGPVCEAYFSGVASAVRTNQSSPSNGKKIDENFDGEKFLAQIGIHTETVGKLWKIRFREIIVQTLKSWNSEAARQTRILERQRLEKLKELLSEGDVDQATDLYRTVFRDVELGYYLIKHNEAKIETLYAAIDAGKVDAKAGQEALKQLEDQIEQYVVKFGRAYGEYLEVREFLETSIEKGALADLNDTLNYGQDGNGGQDNVGFPVLGGATSIQQITAGLGGDVETVTKSARNAKEVLARLGAYPMRGYAPHLQIVKDRLPLSEIKSIFRTYPEAILAKLNVDLFREVKTLALRFPVTHMAVELVGKVVSKLPQGLRLPAQGILDLSTEIRVRRRYLPDIGLVLRTQDDGQSLVHSGESTRRVDKLRKILAKRDLPEGDELLFTFARVIEYRLEWQKLRDEVKKLGEGGEDNWAYARLYERMIKAETDVKSNPKVNEMSLYNPPGAAAAAGKAALYGGLAGYWIYNHPESIAIGLSVVGGTLESLLSGKCVDVESTSICAQQEMKGFFENYISTPISELAK